MSGDDTRHGRRSAVDRLVTAAERRDATRSHTESVPCDLWLVATRQPCRGRVTCLTHDILGTIQRCSRCGAKQRVTGRIVAHEPPNPRQGVTPWRETPGPKPGRRECTNPACRRTPPRGRRTCNASCFRAACSAAGKRGHGRQKRRVA